MAHEAPPVSTADSAGSHEANPEAASQLFPELVRLRFRRFVCEAGYGQPWGVPKSFAPTAWRDPWRRLYRLGGKADTVETTAEMRAAETDLFDDFQKTAGEIISVHWCTTTPSAVALTAKKPGRFRLLRREPDYSLYRASDWVTPEHAPVSELLHHCDVLAIKVAAILPGAPRRIAMRWLFTMESHLLGLIEQRQKLHDSPRLIANDYNGAAPAGSHRLAVWRRTSDPSLLGHAKAEVLEIERYYDRAANKAARIIYCGGMLLGLLVAALLGGVVAFGIDQVFGVVDPHARSTQLFFAAYAGGAVGAVISVLTRMKQEDFNLDYEVGRAQSVMLGAFRPFIGAAFGLAVYYAIEGGLMQLPTPKGGNRLYFITLLAFAAGFSERWTQVVMGSATKTVEAALDNGTQSPGPGERSELVVERRQSPETMP
jgi:hypothetical protein